MTEVAFQPPERDVVAHVPARPLGWRILIRPYYPEEKSKGGIFLPDEARDNERILTYCGQVVAMGNKCYTATTRSGIDMSTVDPKPVVGDWVVYGTHGGQKLFLRNGDVLIVTNDDAIIAIIDDPSEFQYYL